MGYCSGGVQWTPVLGTAALEGFGDGGAVLALLGPPCLELQCSHRELWFVHVMVISVDRGV